MMANVVNKTIFSSRVFSVNLVTYQENHRVMTHVDPVQQGRYYKFNVVIKQPQVGGVFTCEKYIINLFNRVYLFRPDLYEHSVTKIQSGKRVLLSIAVNI
ncbi:2OG-Fe(II) oxygenase [Shewanella ulleungensis]|nr:2OG-Fe(II) oxygenase [Shewanella ulleungensis]MCL1148686.1 2OG-Fe(II) oxygenase [Shewanella ulleungensis]